MTGQAPGPQAGAAAPEGRSPALEAVNVTRTYRSPGPQGRNLRGGKKGKARASGGGDGPQTLDKRQSDKRESDKRQSDKRESDKRESDKRESDKRESGERESGERESGERESGEREAGAPGVDALRGVSLRIDPGEYVAILGPSGSGKSTLMHLLGCLDRPTGGTLKVDGRDVATLSDIELAELRNSTIGFVFQSFHLLARTSARDNVALPLTYRRAPRAERRDRAAAALRMVGLGHRLGHWPSQLSGGEQQRVAIARALVGDPRVVLADEPTGNLDTRTGDEVMDLLERLNTEQGVAVVLVTHEPEIARRARRQIHIRDGLVERDTGTPDTPDSVMRGSQ